VRGPWDRLSKVVFTLALAVVALVQKGRAHKAQERGCIAAWRGEVRVYLPQPALPGDAKENVQAQGGTAHPDTSKPVLQQQRQQPQPQRQQAPGRPRPGSSQQKPTQGQGASKPGPGSQQQGARSSKAQAAPQAEHGQGGAHEQGMQKVQRPGQGAQARRPQQQENQAQRTERDRDSALQVTLAPLTELRRSPHLVSE